VEADLKRSLFEKENLMEFAGILDEIDAFEREVVRKAAAVCACTASEADIYRGWGAKKVIVAPNGGVRKDRSKLRGILPQPLTPRHRYALLVGSGHPPNISGFMNLVMPSVARMAPLERIVVAGGATSGIQKLIHDQGKAGLIQDRLVLLGIIPDMTLDCLIENAAVILLPIEYGGGSNVKTVEALLSGRPVLASAAAFRGFEDFADLEAVSTAADAGGFGAQMRACLRSEGRVGAARDEKLGALLWENTLEPLYQEILEQLSRAMN
jgi:hypothetical protein